MSQTTTPSGAACAHNWHDWKPGTVWCNRCQMVSARGNEGVPITGADVEIPKRRQYDTDPATDQPRGGCCAASRVDGWNECVESTRTAVAAVAALIAERDSQKDRVRSVCQLIVAEIGAGCPCNLEDAAAKLIARNAELEAERDALVGARDKVKSLKRELAELQASRSGNFEGYQSAIEWAEHELQAVIDRYGCSALARTPAKENDDG